LYALYHSYDPGDDVTHDRLSYRIRLAHKYGIADILKESIQALETCYPTSLVEWNRLNPAYTTRAITDVNLARLTGTGAVLPAALYVCSQLPVEVLLGPALHYDGTFDALLKADLTKCVRGREKYSRA
ncbi:hypothetical protein FOMPIDRAFT_12386, partial [Fomitopsis schrenkii]